MVTEKKMNFRKFNFCNDEVEYQNFMGPGGGTSLKVCRKDEKSLDDHFCVLSVNCLQFSIFNHAWGHKDWTNHKTCEKPTQQDLTLQVTIFSPLSFNKTKLKFWCY